MNSEIVKIRRMKVQNCISTSVGIPSSMVSMFDDITYTSVRKEGDSLVLTPVRDSK